MPWEHAVNNGEEQKSSLEIRLEFHASLVLYDRKMLLRMPEGEADGSIE